MVDPRAFWPYNVADTCAVWSRTEYLMSVRSAAPSSSSMSACTNRELACLVRNGNFGAG